MFWQDVQMHLHKVLCQKLHGRVHQFSSFLLHGVFLRLWTILAQFRLELVFGNERDEVILYAVEFVDVMVDLETWYGFEQPHINDV